MDWAPKVLALLVSASVRALIAASLAWLLLYIGRARLKSARHAIWSAVTFGMLLAIPFHLWLPPMPLRILKPAPAVETTIAEIPGAFPEAAPRATPAFRRLTWQEALVFVYLAGGLLFLFRLALACGLTRRLVRNARRVETYENTQVFESGRIAVPLTVGWLRPKILVPENWREWEYGKVKAVLAHERAHVRRADWAILAVAAVNRSLFWFHPLAWWLERALARLAEEACDDAALCEVEDRDEYANVLLELAADVRCRGGRVPRNAMAMAGTEIGMRIDRILDEAAAVTRPWTGRRWAGLLVCALPLLWIVSALQLAPARAMGQERATAAVAAPETQAAVEQPPSQSAAPARGAAPRNGDASAPRPRLLKKVAPQYPEAARAAHIEGTVRLSITVAKNGAVTDVTSATGHPLLIPAAADAVRTWVYAPRSAEAHLQVEVPFGLDTATAPPPAAAAASATPDEPAAPRLLSRVEPEYPKLAKQVGAHGQVEMMATVGTDGSVTAVRVLRGHPLLARAAMNAVKQWRYSPPAAPVDTKVILNFVKLDAGASGGQITAAQLIHRVEPVYPPEARRAGAAGLVELSVTIAADGTVKAAQIVKGDPLLAKAAGEAVMQWRYRPTLLSGIPIVSQTRITLNFVAQNTPEQQPQEDARNQPVLRPERKVANGPAGPQESDVLGTLKYLATGSQSLKLVHHGNFAPPRGLSGIVRVKYRIGTDGKVRDIQVEEGHPQLAAAFVDVLKQRVYEPERRSWQPVESSVIQESIRTISTGK